MSSPKVTEGWHHSSFSVPIVTSVMYLVCNLLTRPVHPLHLKLESGFRMPEIRLHFVMSQSSEIGTDSSNHRIASKSDILLGWSHSRMSKYTYTPYYDRWHLVVRVDSLHKRPVMRRFDVSFAVSLTTLLSKQFSCQLCMIPWRSCDITTMDK